ncbi:MAG: 1-deoxy-D-xylulose-5-phosphate reductoisomerase [Methylacidiphilales bacterium]|nr:1-deoxy-D-xylulose-5-phosphate reductoisomerase [Candidatus Methylacidiphilales bacterium]MDW8349177.1 1-deoxy-D-xylulose-5-phosphate reductoisomerase [Verrucomicrobiae bacterium]
MKKRVVILGSTGSIGQSALKVARDLPQHMEVIGLAAHRQVDALLAQAHEFKPQAISISDETLYPVLRSEAPRQTKTFSGASGLIELATLADADLILIAIVGTQGLQPALAAIRSGKDIAVASKEILVMAGEIVMREAERHNVRVLPVDSEHNAIFQCLEGHSHKHISRLILTASGGPFRQSSAEEIARATPAQALRHPTWKMGAKITIDSATLFNKGLEMIEARWLFNVPIDRVDVLIHPQSIIHSMVEFIDGSQLAQMSHTDMCFPIQYAITYPERLPNTLPPLDLTQIRALTFEPPDPVRFPAINLARQAGQIGGTLPAVFNAANEVAVAAFLDEKIPFPAIWETVSATMQAHAPTLHPHLEEILQADAWAREYARAHLHLDCSPVVL